MEGLQLTCEFTFNKKENFASAVFAVLYSPENVPFLPPPLGGGCHCPFKKSNRPPARAERCYWSARRVHGDELETGAAARVSGVGGLLVCLASIQKSSIAKKKKKG